MSFYDTGLPVPSNDPRDLDDNAKHIDELVNSTFPTFVDRLGTTRKTIAGIEADANAATLRSDLAADDGAELVGFKLNAIGAKVRDLQGVNSQFLNAYLFGLIADGDYHPLSEVFPGDLAAAQLHYSNVPITSLTQSVDWAAMQSAIYAGFAQGKQVYVSGTPVNTDELIVPAGAFWFGDGPMLAPMSFSSDRFYAIQGTTILMYGDGAKTYKVNLIAGDGTTTNSVYTNLSAVEPGFDSTYRMVNFWNNDANPTTGAAATQKLFSAAVRCLPGGGTQIRNVSAIPWFSDGGDGVSGYNTQATLDSADWDFGFVVDNVHDCIFDNVTARGYWRTAGLFGRTAMFSSEAGAPDWERNNFIRCQFQGFASILIRGPDLYDIKAVGVDSIDIDWFDSHGFDPAIENSIRTQQYGGTFHTYTGTQKVGAFLRLTGVTPSPAAINPADANNKVIGGWRTNGCADACFRGTYALGLHHQKALRATSSALGAKRYTTPSRAIEVSGSSLRGMVFDDTCKIITGDDIGLYLNNVLQFGYNGSIESQDVESRGNGIRLIGNINTFELSLGKAFVGSSGVCAKPAYPTTDSRFTNVGDLGFFSPNQVRWEGWQTPVEGHNDTRPGTTQRTSWLNAAGSPVVYRSPDGEYVIVSEAGVKIAEYLATTDTWKFRSDNNVVATSAGVNRFASDLLNANAYGSIIRLFNVDGTVVMMRIDSTTQVIDVAATMRPDADGTRDVAQTARRMRATYSRVYVIGTSGNVQQLSGAGTPEGVITAPVGSTFQRSDGAALTSFYVKESGTGNTGWVAK